MTTPPPNARDNMAFRSWPSQQPQYENWYALVNHRTKAFSFWFRYTLLSTSTGVKEARVWAIPVWGDGAIRSRVLTAALPQDAYRQQADPWRIGFGDQGSVEHGRYQGRVKDEKGEVEWDLRCTPASQSVVALNAPLVQKLVSKSSHRSPNSAVLMSGVVTVDGERVEFVDATAHQGHTEGQQMQKFWVWARAAGFDGDDGAMFEGVSIERGAKPLTTFTVAAQGQRFVLNELKHLKGRALGLLGGANHAEWQLGQWQLGGQEGGRQFKVNVNGIGQAPVLVRYMDTNGRFKFNCAYPLASCAVSITPALSGPNPSTTLLAKGRANMEFVGDSPMHGVAEDYLPVL